MVLVANCGLTNLRGKRKQKRRVRRRKDDEGRMVEGEDDMLEIMAKYWE